MLEGVSRAAWGQEGMLVLCEMVPLLNSQQLQCLRMQSGAASGPGDVPPPRKALSSEAGCMLLSVTLGLTWLEQ